MMLRASTDASPQDPPSDPNAAGETDTRADLLERFVAAVVGDDPGAAEAARGALVDQLGADWLVDVAAVVANFEMMTRIADATGARLRPEQLVAAASIIDDLGLDRFASARR